MKLTDYRTKCSASGLKDIEVLQQHDTVAGNVKNSATDAVAVCETNHGAEERFHEVEPDRVASRHHWYRITEIPVALAGVDVRDSRTCRWIVK